MNSPDKKTRELRHKEQELRKREQESLLHELEAEIDRSVPEYLTSKYKEPDSQVNGKLKQWRRKILAIAQFTGIVIAVVVVVRIATWLATALMVGGIALIAYKMFVEED
ncbi:hypothetical protein NDI43_26615 [Microcoleus vaginatus GB2-A3]|uniref:hypothetical protein n=1 Tax=Microcoleus vaginatus TaxID=119532 RepID=UPI0032AB9481